MTLEMRNTKPTTMTAHPFLLHPGRRLAFWAMMPFVALQGLRLRKRAPRFATAKGAPTGAVGEGLPLRLLAIGDSIIAGVGAPTVEAALPYQMAQALAQQLGREVHWSATGRIGATADYVLGRLLPKVPAQPFDVIFISVGVNDVTALRRTPRWRSDLGALLDALRTHSPDALIVLAGLPPLSGFPLLPQPLRFLFGMRARTFDAVAEQEATRRPGVLYSPTHFEPYPERFAADGFHPSPDSYQEWGTTLATRIEPHLPHDALHADPAH